MRLLVACLLLIAGIGPLMAEDAQPVRWRPEYAQLDPLDQQWFSQQNIPGTDKSCCSAADGAKAEETLCPGSNDIACPAGEVGYWARFHISQPFDEESGTSGLELDVDWMRVPDAAVLSSSNRHGVPVVWWWFENGKPAIRCYAPGAKS